MRIALGLEYDGRGFCGWQVQRGQRTVQAVVEAALSRVANHPVATVCAGRTDSGVHASQQVIHFDTDALRSARSWVLGANAGLPDDVSILWACPVDDSFHARFSAVARAYDYVILNRQARPGLWHGRVTWDCRTLDPAAMQAAAAAWLGEHDFSAFRAKGCQAPHPVRTVHEFRVTASDGFIVLSVRANAFLQHMVRNFAGTLLEIGSGRREVVWAAEVLAGRRREAGGMTAPPDGLYLTTVDYPAAHALPGSAARHPGLPCYTGPSFPRRA